LGARIIKFAGLADNNRPSADDQNGFEVSAFWHERKLYEICFALMAEQEGIKKIPEPAKFAQSAGGPRASTPERYDHAEGYTRPEDLN
jgi:hypothetical protein